jgi:hypothetical protein
MSKRTGLLRDIAEWVNKKGPGLTFVPQDIMADMPDLNRSQVMRSLNMLLTVHGWDLPQVAPGVYRWNGTITPPERSPKARVTVPQPAPSPMIYEFVGRSNTGKVVQRDLDGNLWIAMPLDLDF